MKEYNVSRGHYVPGVGDECQKIKLGRRTGVSLYWPQALVKREPIKNF